MLLLPALRALLLIPSVLAAFTRNDRVCWRHNCVVRMDTGTLCFEPRDNGTEHDECADNFLESLMRVHTTSTIGRSIAYYDDKTRPLGAATWVIPPAMSHPVFVCMTGKRLDSPSEYRTICREAHNDNDMETPTAHIRECVSDAKPQYVSDGCYSLDKPTASKDDHKEWYEQPVVAGIFWSLGVLVTLERVCLWADSAARAVHARLPKLIVILVAVFQLLARCWRRAVVPLPTQRPAASS